MDLSSVMPEVDAAGAASPEIPLEWHVRETLTEILSDIKSRSGFPPYRVSYASVIAPQAAAVRAELERRKFKVEVKGVYGAETPNDSMKYFTITW